MDTGCFTSVPALAYQTPAEGSSGPKGFTPLNSKWARPSQKLLKLKTALILVGVLRAVTRRMLTPTPPTCTLKTASETGVPMSTDLSVAGSVLMPAKLVNLTPCEPTMSLESRTVVEAWKSGGVRTWNGKSPVSGVLSRVSFGPLTTALGPLG